MFLLCAAGCIGGHGWLSEDKWNFSFTSLLFVGPCTQAQKSPANWSLFMIGEEEKLSITFHLISWPWAGMTGRDMDC